MNLPKVAHYHIHVYFDANTVEQATQLCIATRGQFNIPMGRVHEKNVGPHPCWSCQLTLPSELLGSAIEYLNFKRQGLTVFIHPETGNDLVDHTEYLIWLGESKTLKIDLFL